MSGCLFCEIAAGNIPAKKLYEDDLCLAFYDIEPKAPTHYLVIPKAHIASAAAVNEENCSLVGHLFKVISALAGREGLSDFRVVSNCGAQAGQSVAHLHFHVLAGRTFSWPPG